MHVHRQPPVECNIGLYMVSAVTWSDHVTAVSVDTYTRQSYTKGLKDVRYYCSPRSSSLLHRRRYDDHYNDGDRGGRSDRWSNRNTEMDHRRRGRSSSPANQEPAAGEEPPVKKKKPELDPILSRTGGAYIPPAKLRMMQAQITDKTR